MIAPPSNTRAEPGQVPAVAGSHAEFADSSRASLFEPSGYLPQVERNKPVPLPQGVFDVCHVGMVLRAVLFVETVLALGIAFIDDGFAEAGLRLALGSAMALPALLLWLSLACSLRRQLARLGQGGQWVAAAALGAACAAIAWALLQWASLGLFSVVAWPGPVASGAFLALCMTVWLQLRNRAALPANTAARLAELQSRIRPHFLFNTLNSALGLVRRDPQRAEALLEDLSELFRVALANDASVVSLGDEIDLARRYLAIEQIRFGTRLQVVWQLDPAAAAARVPPLLLQPLVENAVRHGVEPDPQGGVIRISSRVRHGQAWLSITNTLPSTPRAAEAPGHGIALQNVRERLRLMHDVAARFDIEADEQKFRVQLAIPLDGADSNAGAMVDAR
ncbi:MAG: histidine kinase [Ideonella sp.]